MTAQALTLLIAVATVSATLLGAYAAWRKWKPEAVNIHVTSADTLVSIATRTAEREAAEADGLQRKLDELALRMAAQERMQEDLQRKLREAGETIKRLEERAVAAERRADAAEQRAVAAEARAAAAELRAQAAAAQERSTKRDD